VNKQTISRFRIGVTCKDRDHSGTIFVSEDTTMGMWVATYLYHIKIRGEILTLEFKIQNFLGKTKDEAVGAAKSWIGDTWCTNAQFAQEVPIP
jgi:hypothetical protein